MFFEVSIIRTTYILLINTGILTTFFPSLLLFFSHFRMILLSYRFHTPSTHKHPGFGQKSLESLLTNVGTNDVRDVMKVADHVKNLSCIDEKRIGICGGSHGGFLTGHCTGQYPGYFQAAVMRNPVTNIASMVTATDIPDWCYGEVFGRYDYTSFRAPTGNELQEMHKMSPVSYISNVKTPTLIALGLKDLRVPYVTAVSFSANNNRIFFNWYASFKKEIMELLFCHLILSVYLFCACVCIYI